MQSRTMRRPLLIGGAAALGALALTLGGAVAANAHIGLSGSSVEAGTSTLLTFSFSHGCDGSPTTEIAIQIPDGINAVAPTANSGWTVEKVMETLDTPITDSHGEEVTERVGQIVYTAITPVADGIRDALVLSLTLPEDAAGTTLAFPTVQSCEVGETAWVEIPADGQDAHDLAAPAPSIAVTAAAEGGDDHGAATNEHDSEASTTDTGPASEAPAQTPLIVTSLVVGTLGLLTGVVALLRGRTTA